MGIFFAPNVPKYSDRNQTRGILQQEIKEIENIISDLTTAQREDYKELKALEKASEFLTEAEKFLEILKKVISNIVSITGYGGYGAAPTSSLPKAVRTVANSRFKLEELKRIIQKIIAALTPAYTSGPNTPTELKEARQILALTESRMDDIKRMAKRQTPHVELLNTALNGLAILRGTVLQEYHVTAQDIELAEGAEKLTDEILKSLEENPNLWKDDRYKKYYGEAIENIKKLKLSLKQVIECELFRKALELKILKEDKIGELLGRHLERRA